MRRRSGWEWEDRRCRTGKRERGRSGREEMGSGEGWSKETVGRKGEENKENRGGGHEVKREL